jgi:hypothetical protein
VGSPRLLNTDDVIATFGARPEQSSVPLARLSRLYDVLNGLVIVADIEPYQPSRARFTHHISTKSIDVLCKSQP